MHGKSDTRASSAFMALTIRSPFAISCDDTATTFAPQFCLPEASIDIGEQPTMLPMACTTGWHIQHVILRRTHTA
jgi:hypothetical protein